MCIVNTYLSTVKEIIDKTVIKINKKMMRDIQQQLRRLDVCERVTNEACFQTNLDVRW